MGSLLLLAAGCGKTEKAAPATEAAEKPTRVPVAEPARTTEKVLSPTSNAVAPTSNAVVATTESAKTTRDTVLQAQSPAATPVNAAASEAGAAPKPGIEPQAQATTSLAALSQDQMVQGLEEALGKGLQQAIARLGHDGGFLTNLNVKILMPEKMQKVESTLRAMKQDKLADDFVATMNHAAEQAVPEAGTVFADALKQMTIENAKSILTGPNDAATQYFQKTTQTNLYAKFYPIVQKATAKAGVTSAYKKIMEKADLTKSLGSLGSTLGGAFLDKDSLDLDAHVSHKAMDGLFKVVAEEEKQIRQSPVARTTDMLQKVFGALKQ